MEITITSYTHYLNVLLLTVSVCTCYKRLKMLKYYFSLQIHCVFLSRFTLLFAFFDRKPHWNTCTCFNIYK